MRPSTLHKCFKFHVILRFTGYAVIAEKPHVDRFTEFFSAPCKKNYALDRKMFGTF